MTDLEQGELRVVVPVGFLLPEEREVAVEVDRPDGGRLPIRLLLVPARPAGRAPVNQPTPLTVGWPARRVPAPVPDDGYPAPDYGGGD